MRYSENERGYTMIEMMMYISVLIILGGVLASYAHKAMNRYKTGRVTQQVVELKKAILHFTAADEDYRNVSVENMDTHHSLPLDMRSGDKTRAVHAMGGSIEIGPAAASPVNADDENKYYMFFIKFDHLPKDSCVEILTQGQFYGEGSEMDTLIVNHALAWQFPYSFYDTRNYDGGGISTTLEFALKCMSKGPDGECIKQESTKLDINEALRACTEESNNEIVWIFS